MTELEYQLAEEIADCVAELRLIRDVLEELRVDFQWAVHNGKNQNQHCSFISEASAQVERAANAISRLSEALNEIPVSAESTQAETPLRSHSLDISKSPTMPTHQGQQQELF